MFYIYIHTFELFIERGKIMILRYPNFNKVNKKKALSVKKEHIIIHTTYMYLLYLPKT